MDNAVIIKGLNHGIVVVLDPEIEYNLLKEKIAQKFRESAKFLGNAQMALKFEGRELSDLQQREILDIIGENSDLHIACVLSDDQSLDNKFQKFLENNQESNSNSNINGQLFKGNLRSGQSLESQHSIIVIGDVNPGASIVSNGNIIIIGTLKGTVFAGASGNENAFVFALDMNPVQIRISDTIARAPDDPTKIEGKEAKIAFLENENIYIEPISRQVLNDIRL